MSVSLPTHATIQAIPPVKSSLAIVSRRATFKGIQYIVSGQFSDEVVTIHNETTTCTCGLAERFLHCPHKPLVQAQEEVYQREARQRQAYCGLFNLYEV